MPPLESPPKELDAKHVDNVVKFVSDVRSGKLEGSNNIALATVALLEQVINNSQNANACDLSNMVRSVGRELCAALPAQLVSHNMARRVLRAIRDERRASHHPNTSGGGGGESLQQLVLGAGTRRHTVGPQQADLREPLREHIAEIRLELESTTSVISACARSHVHGDELILTSGPSGLAERFLRAAAPRKYRLIVAEGTRVRESHQMASRLAAAGVSVTVVSNAAVAGLMSRVNKVVLSALAALAGGAALAAPGAAAIAAAAQYYSVPVIMVSPLYKLCPLHAAHQHQFGALASPAYTATYTSVASSESAVVSPQYDLIPPDQITLFITNLGGSSPSYIYRLLSELYDQQDYQL